MGHAKEAVETHILLPHTLPPGVHATLSVLPTTLEKAVATLILHTRTWGLQEAAQSESRELGYQPRSQ